MVAGTLAGAGYFMGDDLVGPRESNPKGFFEDRGINRINEALLAEAVEAREPDDESKMHIPLPRQYWLADLPGKVKLARNGEIDAKITDAVARAPYCYKDPRFCYTLDAWRPRLRGTVFVCVFREPSANARSILKEIAFAKYLSTMRLSYEQALGLWRSMYSHVLNTHRHEGRWLFIHYKQMLTAEGLDRLAVFTGAPVDRSFPDRTLQRTASDDSVDAQTQAIYRQLCALAGAEA
jgi:hypothetical protein